jgi:glycosyltransferase involved in cell wall biosynthesis
VIRPDISIVVCTHNRARLLRGALASLADLETDGQFSYEIVVIDNASTDDTPAVIDEAASASKHPVRGVHEPQKGIIAARNRGLVESRGRLIAFFDDDQLADRRWLAELYLGALENQCYVVGGAVHLALPAGCSRRLHAVVRMILGESVAGQQPRRYGGRFTPGCGNLMVERSIFKQIGGFQVSYSGRGEDTDLFVRMERAEIAAWYLPQAIVHHVTPSERLTNGYLLDLGRRMGEGIALRQANKLGKALFALLWLAKAARSALIYYPLLVIDRLSGDDEKALGRRCQLAIDGGFFRAGWSCLRPRRMPAATLANTTSVKPIPGTHA